VTTGGIDAEIENAAEARYGGGVGTTAGGPDTSAGPPSGGNAKSLGDAKSIPGSD